MQNIKNIDIFDLGKNTFNSCFSQLKNDKKVLWNFSQNIEKYLNSLEENKGILQNINREIDKNSSVDRPFCFLKKFEIILKLECNYFDYFLEKSSNSFEQLKELIDKNFKIISNFLSNAQVTNSNIKNKSGEFLEKYDKVVKSLEQTEKSIIDDYIQSTYKIQTNRDKTKINTIEELVNESHKCEKDFLYSTQNMKEIFRTFLNEYNTNMKEIKINMTQLNEECKNYLINAIKIMKENSNNLLNLVNDSSAKLENFDKNNNKFVSGYSEYLNNEIKEDELFQVLSDRKYKIKIIRDEEKNLLENENFKPKNSTNNKQTQNLKITEIDIYNIVSKLYNYNFETIDKEEYNLDIEKDKIEITKFTGKILGYDFFNLEEFKNEALSQNEINNFIDFIFTKEVYLIEFLMRLNNYRSTGKYEFSMDLFNTIKIIFDKSADYLMKNKNERIYNFLIILSQTFYVMKNNEKYFLQKELKNKEFFSSTDNWFNKIDSTIRAELERFQNEVVKNYIDLSEKKKEKKKEEIIYTKLISYIASLNGFELDKEKIDKIILPLFDKYNVKEEMRQSILPLLNVYKNNI